MKEEASPGQTQRFTQEKTELESWSITVECVSVCVLNSPDYVGEPEARERAAMCQGTPEPGAGLGRGPVAPGATGACLCWSPETVNWGAVSTGPGLGPSLPTCSQGPRLPQREEQGAGSCSIPPWSPSRLNVEQLPEALADLWPLSHAGPLSRSDPVCHSSPWPSVSLLDPSAPCCAGLNACLPREVASAAQARLKARSLCQFLIHGLCSGGRDTTLQKMLLAEKRACQPVCRVAGAAGLQVQLDPGVSPPHTLSLSALLPALWLYSWGVCSPGGRLGSHLRAGERNPVPSLLEAPESHTGFTDCHWLTHYYELNCAPSERYVETLAQYLQI